MSFTDSISVCRPSLVTRGGMPAGLLQLVALLCYWLLLQSCSRYITELSAPAGSELHPCGSVTKLTCGLETEAVTSSTVSNLVCYWTLELLRDCDRLHIFLWEHKKHFNLKVFLLLVEAADVKQRLQTSVLMWRSHTANIHPEAEQHKRDDSVLFSWIITVINHIYYLTAATESGFLSQSLIDLNLIQILPVL